MTRRVSQRKRRAHGVAVPPGRDVLGRRAFLRRSGLVAGGLAAAAIVPGRFATVRAAAPEQSAAATRIRTVCTHCSVGCGLIAEVENGVWTGQEPDQDHPISLGGLCARGAAARYDVLSARRIKQPLKLTNGDWMPVTWEQAINEIGEKLLELHARSGADSVYWLGSAHHSNEQAYLLRKLAAFWGTNNIDQEARLFHAGADAGLAQTWGFGAATNSFNDLHNARSIFVIGGSPAEDQPLSMLHILRARERNNAPLIVCDPRYSETAALADEYIRYRPGTDVALIWGLVREIFAKGWVDRKFVRARVGGAEKLRAAASKYTPEEVERVTGVPPSQLQRAAKALAGNRPGAVIWTNPGTQNVLASSATRAFAALQLVLGNVGVAGGGASGYRLHDNAQGTSDMGVLCDSLPGYYGLDERAWRHWARVWQVDYEFLLERFGGDEKAMARPGIAGGRWFDGALAKKDELAQANPLGAVMIWGHAAHLTSRLGDMRRALGKLDLVVNIAPWPNMASVFAGRRNGAYLLPSTTQFETAGSVTNSHRAVQWREPVVAPLFGAKPEQEIIRLLADRLGLGGEMFKTLALPGGAPTVEDINREANSGMLQTGYCGHAPERLKLHREHGASFDRRTLRAEGGPADGDFFGLPWPCWGKPELKHPGTPVLFDISRPVAEGGLPFPAIFGLERGGKILWAEGSYPKESDIKDGYPEFTALLLTHLSWDDELTPAERKAMVAVEGEETDWRTDLSGAIHRIALAHGCAPFGNGKARVFAWEAVDPVPVHREPIYTPRRDLVERGKAKGQTLYRTFADGKGFRLARRLAGIQAEDVSERFPLVLTTGRLAEHDVGGEGTRANALLAELRRRMFVEMHPFDANNIGAREGDAVWVHGPSGGRVRAAAVVTKRVARGVVFLPVSFAGHWQGESLRAAFPDDSDAVVLGDAAGAVMGAGYDPVGGMPEILCGLCRIEKA